MRQRAEEMEAYSGSSGHYGMHDIKLAAKDIKSWIHGFIQIAVVTILYGKMTRLYTMADGMTLTTTVPGFGTFLPIIIKDGFNFSTVQAQYLVIPVNLWGAIVYAAGAILSDKYTSRFLPLVICAPFGIAGYAILLAPVSASVHYFGTFLIATACFLCTGGNM